MNSVVSVDFTLKNKSHLKLSFKKTNLNHKNFYTTYTKTLINLGETTNETT